MIMVVIVLMIVIVVMLITLMLILCLWYSFLLELIFLWWILFYFSLCRLTKKTLFQLLSWLICMDIFLYWILIVWVKTEDLSEENSNDKSYYDKQVCEWKDFFSFISTFHVFLDGVSCFGEDVHDGHVEKQTPCKCGTDCPEHRSLLETFWEDG